MSLRDLVVGISKAPSLDLSRDRAVMARSSRLLATGPWKRAESDQGSSHIQEHRIRRL